MNIEEEIEKIKQNKPLKHIELDNEFDEREDLFVDKIDEKIDDEKWTHQKECNFYCSNSRFSFSIERNIFVKNIYLEIKYNKIDVKTKGFTDLIINKLKEIRIEIYTWYYLIWNTTLDINNLIVNYINNDDKNNLFKIPLACLMKHKILYTNDFIRIEINQSLEDMEIYVHYDFKKSYSETIFINEDCNHISNYNVHLDFLYDYNFIYFYGMPYFMILSIQNEGFNENIGEITFNLIVEHDEKIKLYEKNGFDETKEHILALKNKMIKVIIPKEKMITYKFMNKIFYIFGLNKQFTGIKSIKKILYNKYYDIITNNEFLTIMKDIQFFPPISNLKNVSFYCF